jgi:hypothetical protein
LGATKVKVNDTDREYDDHIPFSKSRSSPPFVNQSIRPANTRVVFYLNQIRKSLDEAKRGVLAPCSMLLSSALVDNVIERGPVFSHRLEEW